MAPAHLMDPLFHPDLMFPMGLWVQLTHLHQPFLMDPQLLLDHSFHLVLLALPPHLDPQYHLDLQYP